MKSLKHSLFALSQECIDGSYEGWRGGQDAPTLDDVEYLGAQWYRHVSAGFLFAHLDGVVDINEHVAARARIVEVLANYKVALADSRRRALDMLVDSYPLLSGTNDELVNRLGIAPDELGKVESAVVEDVALDLLLHDQHRIHYLRRHTRILTPGYRRLPHEDIDEIQCDD